MRKVIYDAKTKKLTYMEDKTSEVFTPPPTEPSIEDRLVKQEQVIEELKEQIRNANTFAQLKQLIALKPKSII